MKKSHLSVVGGESEGKDASSPPPTPQKGEADDLKATIIRLKDQLPGLVAAGYVAEVRGGYVLTTQGSVAGALLVSLAMLDAEKQEVDVEDTNRLRAWMTEA